MTMRKLFYLTIAIIMLSPLIYLATGIGQQAHTLSQDPIILAGGTIQSSPKAQALHTLRLPMGIQHLLIYPVLLLLMQYSGLAVKMRKWLTDTWLPPVQRFPGYGWLNTRLTRLAHQHLTLNDVVVIGLYLTLFDVGLTLIYFPLSRYGFVLDHQFGLATQTLSAWLRDFGVSWLVGWMLTLVSFGGFYILIKLIPHRWPIWVGAGFTVFTFAVTLLQPVLITPLFYKISPVTDPNLQQRIQTMAKRAGVVIDDISIIDASSKTTAINAYFTGFGGASKIFLYDTLISKHPPDEVDVVIAHEMGHWVYKHHLLSIVGMTALGWLSLFAWRFWSHRVWRQLGWTGPDDVASYPYLLALLAIAGILTLPLINGVSRLAEAQADDFALAISQKPVAAVAMFEGMARENLAVVDPPTWEKFIFYSHPPIANRIEKARSFVKSPVTSK